MYDTQKPPLDELAHYGVKGMKWGERKHDGPDGVSAKVNREAKKDAAEFTKAKLFYGEGAGTRRKLIKAKVTEKSKNEEYKKAFDHHVDKTDLSKRATQATRERKRKDATNSVKKTSKGVHHILNGNSQYANMAAALAVGGYMYLRKSGIDKVIKKHGEKAFNDVKRRTQSDADIADMLRKFT